MRIAAVLLAVLALAGCSKKQPALSVPPGPQPSTGTAQPQAPPVKRRPAPASPATERAREEREQPLAAPRILKPMGTQEERAAVVRQIESSIRKAEQDLAAFLGRQPSGASEDVEMVRSLLRQARSAQSSSDLSTARSFAQRAEILAADLRNR